MKQKNDLLNDNIYQLLLKLSIPLIMGDILQQFYNMIDAVIIGIFVGNRAFAAVGVAGTVMNLFLFSVVGFSMGIVAILSQYYGERNYRSFRRESYLVLIPGSITVVIFSAALIGMMQPVLNLIQTPSVLIPYVKQYLTVIFCGMLISYLYNIFNGILQSVGNTKAVLKFLTVSIIGNVILDYVFVGITRFGIRGAAIATCIAQAISAGSAFVCIRKQYSELLFKKEDMQIERSMIQRTLHFGLVSMLHQASLYFGKILVQGAVNLLGVVAISAYTATTRIEGFINSFSTSGSQAMSITIGQNLGAGQKDRVKECLKKGMVLLSLLGLALSAVLFIGAPAFLKLVNKNAGAEELRAGVQYLKWVSVFYIFNYIGSAFVGYFRGIGRVEVAFKGTIVQMIFRILISYACIRIMNLEAVAIATGIGWIAIVIYQTWTYHKINRPAK